MVEAQKKIPKLACTIVDTMTEGVIPFTHALSKTHRKNIKLIVYIKMKMHFTKKNLMAPLSNHLTI